MARLIEVERALGHVFEPPPSHWDERDLSIYALATGGAGDPAYDRSLGRARSSATPPAPIEPSAGFFATLALNALVRALKDAGGAHLPGLNYGIERVIHERHSVDVLSVPTDARGSLLHRGRIAAIYDTGRHGLVVTEVESRAEGSDLVLRSEITSLVRSAGGFGGPRPDQAGAHAPTSLPDRAPEWMMEQPTRTDQALLYRLLGDDNAIHVDARAARAFGLRRPILHGMCTFGFALRHLQDSVAVAAGGAPPKLASVSVRFSDVVYPGETLVTEAWSEADGLVRFQTRTKERAKVVLSQGQLRFAGTPRSGPGT